MREHQIFDIVALGGFSGLGHGAVIIQNVKETLAIR